MTSMISANVDGRCGAWLSSCISALDAMSAPGRIFWLTARVLAASVTVPIAEELAFRGYLMRRLVAADFESVDPRRYTWFSLAASSIVFGAMHGSSWFAGSAAGLVYGGLYARSGRIGDPVVAHATTNILLAVCVLAFRPVALLVGLGGLALAGLVLTNANLSLVAYAHM